MGRKIIRRGAKNVLGMKIPEASPKPIQAAEKPHKNRRRPVHIVASPESERLAARARTVRANRLSKQLEAGLLAKTQVEVPAAAVEVIEWKRPLEETVPVEAAPVVVGVAPTEVGVATKVPARLLRINVPTGIGDFSWIYSKLLAMKLPMDVVVAKGHPPRLVPIAELLPSVYSMSVGRVGYEIIDANKVGPKTSRQYLLDWPADVVIPISANRHLEQGNRIETWLPELPVDHHYKVEISPQHVAAAEALLPYKDFVCLFAANKKTCEAWSGWMAPQWCDFMQLFRRRIGDLPFVLIGAGWDIGLGGEIACEAERTGIPLTDLTGKTILGASFHIMKRSKYFIAFPSGMAVFGHVLKIPTTMFYPDCLQNMIGTFDSPEARETNRFYETPFCSPSSLVDWLINVYGIKNKI